MLKVKSWFIDKIEDNGTRRALQVGDPVYSIEKETEKAYRLSADTDFGTVYFWCPKSCTIEEEELSDEEKRERGAREMAEFDAMLNRGLAYNNQLKEYAVANGIKLRNINYTTRKLIEKITEAGLTVPARA